MEFIKDLKKCFDYVAEFGGYREKEILKNVVSVSITMDTMAHKVYRFEDEEGYSFEYDSIQNKIVG